KLYQIYLKNQVFCLFSAIYQHLYTRGHNKVMLSKNAIFYNNKETFTDNNAIKAIVNLLK
ncbi:MAG: hypothetical protein L0I96_07985, partial [Lactococcus sp.]|nr:hypothetical protein [Lactococcus sp.]